MPLTPADPIALRFDPTYGRAGLGFASEVLALAARRPDLHPQTLIRTAAIEGIADLAVRRWLDQRRLRYQIAPYRPESPRPYLLTLGGRRATVIPHRFPRLPDDTTARAHIETWLPQSINLSLNLLNHPALGPKDLLLIAAVTARETPEFRPHATAFDDWLHLLPEPWRFLPASDTPHLIRLIAREPTPLYVTVAGLAPNGRPARAALELPPNQPQPLRLNWLAITHLHAERQPTSPLFIQIPRLNLSVDLNAWYNAWLYVHKLILLGWNNHTGVRQHGHIDLAQQTCTLPLNTLRPLTEILLLLRAADHHAD